MGGADRIPAGPEGRGPFDQNDAFVLPDGRVYVPGDACTDDLYGVHFSFSGESCGGYRSSIPDRARRANLEDYKVRWKTS